MIKTHYVKEKSRREEQNGIMEQQEHGGRPPEQYWSVERRDRWRSIHEHNEVEFGQQLRRWLRVVW